MGLKRVLQICADVYNGRSLALLRTQQVNLCLQPAWSSALVGPVHALLEQAGIGLVDRAVKVFPKFIVLRMSHAAQTRLWRQMTERTPGPDSGPRLKTW